MKLKYFHPAKDKTEQWDSLKNGKKSLLIDVGLISKHTKNKKTKHPRLQNPQK